MIVLWQERQYDDPFQIVQREYIWNNVRPHQALGYLTPNQYFWKLKTSRLATKDVIILQT